ncbi:sulfhydryl oxidase 1-like [Rhineura floridana]|uniref:sulfhydryl oxidase 1-like n=1 Tax=Rhineura floridana TaxID=261503 RepID=UPI002AC8487B|nr:sulfhydryl oxidase 1-like [Rhineura floridana]
MVQFENITVRRVLKGNAELVSRCNVTTFPSGFLLLNKDSCKPIPLENILRPLYTGFLQTLPEVIRETFFEDPEPPRAEPKTIPAFWEAADRTKVYMADLDSAVLCSLKRIEVRFSYLDEEHLSALKQFVNILAKYFPEQSVIKDYLHKLDVWLKSDVVTNVSRSEWTEALRATKEGLNVSLPDSPVWVSCQGSSPGFESYSYSVWILFHLLTVQEALKSDGSDSPLEVLPAMREFMRNFYGCPDNAKHFESLAAESLNEVKSKDEAILWLWSSFAGTSGTYVILISALVGRCTCLLGLFHFL